MTITSLKKITYLKYAIEILYKNEASNELEHNGIFVFSVFVSSGSSVPPSFVEPGDRWSQVKTRFYAIQQLPIAQLTNYFSLKNIRTFW